MSSVAIASACAAAPPGAVTPAAPAPVAASGPADISSAPQAVIDRARRAMREAGFAADAKLASSEPAQWNDSSLGCSQPGMQYLQVITSGHIVRFVDRGTTHEVHVAGEQAVICGPTVAGAPKRPRPVRAKDVQESYQRARDDLATRLGIPAEQVTMVGTEPHTWPNDAMECATVTSNQPLEGFRFVFDVQGRLYSYHSDLKRVLPCPSIEAQ